MGFVGLDVVAIRALSANLRGHSRELEQISRELAGAVAEAQWFGADARAFDSAWQSVHAPGIARAGSVMERAANLAQRQAAEQERVSRS